MQEALEVLAAVFGALQSHPLEELDVSGNALGCAGIKLLAPLLCATSATLVRLRLDNTGFSAGSTSNRRLQPLIRALAECAQLLLDALRRAHDDDPWPLQALELHNNMMGGHLLCPVALQNASET